MCFSRLWPCAGWRAEPPSGVSLQLPSRVLATQGRLRACPTTCVIVCCDCASVVPPARVHVHCPATLLKPCCAMARRGKRGGPTGSQRKACSGSAQTTEPPAKRRERETGVVSVEEPATKTSETEACTVALPRGPRVFHGVVSFWEAGRGRLLFQQPAGPLVTLRFVSAASFKKGDRASCS